MNFTPKTAQIEFQNSIERARQIGRLDFFDLSDTSRYPNSTITNLPGLISCGLLTSATEITHAAPLNSRDKGLSFYMNFAGHLDLSIDGRTIVVPSGQMAVARPNQCTVVHPATNFISPGSCGWLFLDVKSVGRHWVWPKWITLPPCFLREIETMIRALKVPLFDISPAFAECFKFIRYTHARRQQEDSFSARLAPFITLLVVEIRDTLFGQPPLDEEPQGEQEALRKVKKVAKTLAARYADKNVTIEALALEAGLCRSLFSRLFTRLTGETPRRYILTLRLEEAKRLLAGTDRSVADIADAVGFLGTSRLFELFKERTGLAPLDYRAATQGR